MWVAGINYIRLVSKNATTPQTTRLEVLMSQWKLSKRRRETTEQGVLTGTVPDQFTTAQKLSARAAFVIVVTCFSTLFTAERTDFGIQTSICICRDFFFNLFFYFVRV